jgi:hypothetical protein
MYMWHPLYQAQYPSWSHLFESFTVATMPCVTVMEYLCHKWPRICFVRNKKCCSGLWLRNVWRNQRGSQNPYIEEDQTTQWPKEKVQKDKQRSTKHTYKTEDWVTRTPLKIFLSHKPEQHFLFRTKLQPVNYKWSPVLSKTTKSASH